LSTLDPARPSPDVRDHLDECEYCRDWHNDLCLFERSVPYLPVPRSRGKAKVLERLLSPSDKLNTKDAPRRDTTVIISKSATDTVVDAPVLPLTNTPAPAQRRFFTFQGLMTGLAAVVVFLLGGWLRRQ
jgi:hypothetical protein